jgi:hypothetical protein
LHEGIPRVEPLRKLLPSAAEASFGLGWANLVDFVAAMQYDVDYNQTNYMQGLVVPPRMLTDVDHAPHIKDFTAAENRAAASIELCYVANQVSGGVFLKVFKALCCTPAGRADAQKALIGFLADPARCPYLDCALRLRSGFNIGIQGVAGVEAWTCV